MNQHHKLVTIAGLEYFTNTFRDNFSFNFSKSVKFWASNVSIDNGLSIKAWRDASESFSMISIKMKLFGCGLERRDAMRWAICNSKKNAVGNFLAENFAKIELAAAPGEKTSRLIETIFLRKWNWFESKMEIIWCLLLLHKISFWEPMPLAWWASWRLVLQWSNWVWALETWLRLWLKHKGLWLMSLKMQNVKFNSTVPPGQNVHRKLTSKI